MLYPNLPSAEYHARTELSSTTIRRIVRGAPMAQVRHELDHPKPSTTSQGIGSAFHALALEPEKDLVAVYTGKKNRNSNEYKDWAAQQSAPTLLTEREAEGVVGALESPHFAPWRARIESAPHRELSVTWNEVLPSFDIVPCRARFDCILRDGRIMDLKTCGSLDDATIREIITQQRLDVQARHYIQGMDGNHDALGSCTGFLFLFVSLDPPHLVRPVTLDLDSLHRATGDHSAALSKWARCIETGEWPGFPEAPTELGLKSYMILREEVA